MKAKRYIALLFSLVILLSQVFLLSACEDEEYTPPVKQYSLIAYYPTSNNTFTKVTTKHDANSLVSSPTEGDVWYYFEYISLKGFPVGTTPVTFPFVITEDTTITRRYI